MKKLFKYTFRTLLVILLLVIILFISSFFLVQRPAVQTYLVHKVSEYLSKQLGSEVKVDSVNIKFIRTLEIYNVYLSAKNNKADTILFVGKMNADLMIGKTLWEQITNLKQKHIYVDNIDLDRVNFHGYRGENDSIYNFQFIIDQFASKNKNKVKAKVASKPIQLKLNSLQITNSHLILDDQFKDEKFDLQVTKLFVGLNDFDLIHLKINADKIELVDPKFLLTLYGKKPKVIKPPGKGFDVEGMGKSINLSVDKLTMKNGTYGMDIRGKDIHAGSMKVSNMYIHGIESDFKSYKWDSTGMHVDIRNLNAIADDNFVLKQLKAKASMDNNGIHLDGTDISVNDTKIAGNLSVQFLDEWRSFRDFPNKVIMNADIKQAVLKARDVVMFAPSLKKYIPETVQMHGKVKGRLANLRVDQLYVTAGKSTIIDVTGNIKGLPHIQQTLFDLTVNEFKTNTNDLKTLLPFVKLPEQIANAGNISFKGTYFGFTNDFVAKGALNTDNLGNLVVQDLHMTFPKNQPPTYSGTVTATGLNLAELTGNHKLLGKVDIDLKVNGNGFNTKQLNTQLTGNIRNFYFNGFVFDKIKVDGLIDKKKFEGKAFFDDSCFLVDFNGIADFNDTIPKFDFKTSIKNADLYKLHLTKDTMMVSLDGEVHFKGNNLDNLVGTGKFSNMILQNEKDILALSDVAVSLENDGLLKNYSIQSDQLTANFKGDFSAVSLVPSMKVFLSHYSKLIKPTEKDFKTARPQQLDVTLKLKSDIGLFQVFVPQLKYISELDLNANVDTKANVLQLTAKMDSANYNDMAFDTIILDAHIVDKNLLFNAGIGNLYAKKTNIPDIKLGINSSLDQLLSNISIASDSADNSARLESSIDFNGDSIITRILNSKFTVNKKVWQVQEGNELIIVDSTFIAQNFSLVQGDQKINIQNGRNTLSDAKINVENLNLADIDQLVDSSGAVSSGKLTGSINLKNILTKLQANVDVTINDLQVLDYKIKYIGLDGVYGRNGKNILEAGGTIEDPDYQLSFDGTYDMQVKGKEKLDAKADIERLNLKFLETVLKKELLVPRAFVKGQVTVSGSLKSPILTGQAQIIDTAELKMRYLGTTFKMVNETIDLTPKGFDFGEITLYDNYGNTALLSGKLLHNGFKDFKVEKVNLSAPSGYNFMNTTYEDNQDFYGKVFARGEVNIDGYFDDLSINVDQLYVLKNSVFNLPVSSHGSDKGYSFVRFVDPKDTTKRIDYKTKVSGINLKMNIAATPEGVINIILDPNTNDKIVARGNGTLVVTMKKNEALTIGGNYNLTEGEYTFNFQGIVNKPFKIKTGSHIDFVGDDPMKAEMNITGLYHVPAASIRNIVDSSSPIRNRTFPIDLELLVRGTLSSPEISFNITTPSGSISAQSDELTRKLDDIRSNPNELNNQAVALLLFNTFFPTSTSGDQRFTGASNTVTQLISAQLSNLFSRGLGILIPGASLDLLLSDVESKESRNFGFSYKQEIGGGRLILTIGGNVNFGNTNTTIVSQNGQPANNSAIAGDFQLEYLVTPDGRIRLKTYARTANYDLINQDRIRTGGSVSFQKEFDNLKDLFHTKRKDKVAIANITDSTSIRTKVNDSTIMQPVMDPVIPK